MSAAEERHQNGYWTRDRIVEAIKAFDGLYGRPPHATDWNVGALHALGDTEKLDRFSTGRYPHVTTVRQKFGKWSEAIRAAGFVPLKNGTYGRAGESMTLCREIRERYEAGESTVELAVTYGCTPPTISWRIRKAGGKVRTKREAQLLRYERDAG